LDAIKYPSEKVVRFEYTDGQVTGIRVNSQPLVTNIEYEPFGPASREFEGRVKAYDLGGDRATEILYDRSGRIKELLALDAFGPHQIFVSHQIFDYDPAGALREFTIDGATTILEPPDANGNRTRLTSSGQCPPAAPQCQKDRCLHPRPGQQSTPQCRRSQRGSQSQDVCP
jgi:hypothetical protein